MSENQLTHPLKIKAKKISELEPLDPVIDEQKISDSYIVVSYTENGAKENYKIKIKDIVKATEIVEPVQKEYSIYVYANGASLISQSVGPYYKDTIVSLIFKANDRYVLTDNSPFVVNCEQLGWNKTTGRLNIKITGTGNPTINISATLNETYIIDCSRFVHISAQLPKLIYSLNEDVIITLTPDDGYELPNSITDFTIQNGTITSYSKLTGQLKIKVKGNVVLFGEAIQKPSYTVNISIPNANTVISPNKGSYYKDEQFEITITPNKGYKSPNALNVTNGELISYSNNKAIIKVLGTGNITVQGTVQYIEYPLTLSLTNVTATVNPNKSSYHINDEITISFNVTNEYDLPKLGNITLYGCTRISYNNGVMKVKVSGDKSSISITARAELKEILETYYFGMTYAGEGYFGTDAIMIDDYTLWYFNGTLININSPYISSTEGVTPLPLNSIFDITNNYQNVGRTNVNKDDYNIEMVAILLPSKYVIADGNSYTFLDDNNNQYKLQKLGLNITNFEQLKNIYGTDLGSSFNWAPTVTINGVSHTLLYFKDDACGGEYKFTKIS